MRTFSWSSLLCILVYGLVSCSAEPPVQEVVIATEPEPVSYLYKTPVTSANGLAVARVKKEALAEAFVARLGTKAPSGVVVMQQEKIVLEEYFNKDSAAFVCTGPLFPAYTGALLGSMFAQRNDVPYQAVPLQEFYPATSQKHSGVLTGHWLPNSQNQEKVLVQKLDKLIEQQMQTTQGMAAEELLFEPLQIDDYNWQEGSLCLHPHGLLQLGSLWLRRGKWADEQLLPDRLVQRVLEPAYSKDFEPGRTMYGWQYYRLVAKGRKHPVLYWKNGSGAHLFLLPEVEAVILMQGDDQLMPQAWEWMQQYLIPSLTP